MLTYADVWRMLTYADLATNLPISEGMHADVCWRTLTYADVWRMLTYADLARMLTYDVCWACHETSDFRRYITDAFTSTKVQLIPKYKYWRIY
jgi:hypothetical protein